MVSCLGWLNLLSAFGIEAKIFICASEDPEANSTVSWRVVVGASWTPCELDTKKFEKGTKKAWNCANLANAQALVLQQLVRRTLLLLGFLHILGSVAGLLPNLSRFLSQIQIGILVLHFDQAQTVMQWLQVLYHQLQNVHRELREIKMSEEAAPKALNMLHCNLLVISSQCKQM